MEIFEKIFEKFWKNILRLFEKNILKIFEKIFRQAWKSFEKTFENLSEKWIEKSIGNSALKSWGVVVGAFGL